MKHEIVPAMVARSMAAWSDRCAVVETDGTERSYAWLDDRSNRFACALQASGVGHGDRVGVCRWKSADTVASLLGIMRAGAAYVPVDPGSPPLRNETIFRDCEVRAVVLDASTESAIDLGDGVARLVDPDAVDESFESPAVAAEDLAYILYTSGSTGRPKGVCIEHGQASSFVDWCIRTFEVDPSCRCSSHAPFHFDLSILDLWMPLAVGGCVVLLDEMVAKDPRRLPEVIAERGITNWYSVPSILSLMATHGRLDEHASSSLRTVCFAGEVFPIDGLRRLRDAWPHAIFWNLYGPTETNVCTAFRIPEVVPTDRDDPYPIGPACDHCRVIIADDDGREVDDGSVGRILCTGDPVMRTYWGRDPKDVEAFLDRDGIRWYDTGDLGVRGDGGVIEFHGRRDRMVKRHGYRIELGEIEAGLSVLETLDEVAVIATDDGGQTVIHAFVVPSSGMAVSVIQLRSHCAGHLPSYMVPDRFVSLDGLPRTSTGKVDYQALRKMLSGDDHSPV